MFGNLSCLQPSAFAELSIGVCGRTCYDAKQTHATAKFGNQALEFIAGCPTKQPFCLSLSFNAPHARDGKPREFQPDLRDESLYAGNTITVPPTANEEFFGRLPKFVQTSEGRRRWLPRFVTPELFQRTMRDYFRLVTGIDCEVGRLVEELKQRGLADKCSCMRKAFGCR